MKVCFWGLGSIGKRHLRNLNIVANEKNIKLNIHAYRKVSKPLEKELEDLIDKSICTEAKLDKDYDVAFITNPTSMHFDTMKLMAGKTKHMFIEKPITDYRYYDFNDLKLHYEGVYYVAGPLRFSGVIQELKNIIRDEKVYCVRVICSSYLPGWRPNVDYRTVYSASRDQGGGVCLDLIHEWDYLTYLFGMPEEVKCICGKYSDLEINSEDVAVYIARYEDKVVELHLDYFGRVPRREIEIFTSKGTFVGDLINQRIIFTDKERKEELQVKKYDIYLKEMKFFIEKIVQVSRFNNIAHSRKVLALTKGEIL